ncbi:hypothetical protein JCM33374_g254 [Metschnikowia sp. JCM 33374]|nr:hypothetical protein JCM33374_g254 [Metschnikowia sp. JCM 33374]
MLTGILARCPKLPKYSPLLRTAAGVPRHIGPRRYKWLSRKPSRNMAQHDQMIIEDQSTSPQTPETILELKHYLRSRDLPKDQRIDLLREKTTEAICVPVDSLWSDDYFSTLNGVFMRFYAETGAIDYILPLEKLCELFDKTASFYLDSGRTDYPQYMAILAQKLMRTDDTLPTSVLVNIVEIISTAHVGGLDAPLAHVIQRVGHRIGPDFTKALLSRQAAKNVLNLDSFEAILKIEAPIKHEGLRSHLKLINDDYVAEFIAHIQEIFKDSNPKVHEYLNLGRNLDRVQYIACQTINQYLKEPNTELLLRLLKLKSDLNSVRCSESDKDSIETILMHLQAHGEHENYTRVKNILFTQNIEDEDLINALITQLSNCKGQFDSFLSSMCDFAISDEIKFSPSLRLRADLLKNSIPQRGNSCDAAFPVIKDIYQPFLQDSDNPSGVLTDTLQAISTYDVSDTQNLLDLTCQDFNAQFGVELSILDYKIMIDRAIAHKQRDLATSLFDESLQSSCVHWAESIDPSVVYTLDNLIILVGEGKGSLEDIFARFRTIKQHMSASCSPDALRKLCRRMLAQQCVGDVIELLKRELPNIEKDSYQKIRLDFPYNQSYHKLFHQLFTFVVTYKKDTSFGTNWVLYGELHKYFHIPFKTYLTVIQFFCEADRLNAALLIVRRMKMLSELHVKPNINQPPSPAIYTYLLKVFGDKLYEEGVIELHEYLKMDTNIQTQDINLQNTILNAYSNLQNIGKANDLFLAISSNPKQHGGINEETAQIMIKTYTYSGLPYVQKFWNSLSQYGLYPDYSMFKQYLIAHTYHGSVEEAVKLVEEIDDYNLEFSSDLLLSMHNYCIEPEKQKELVDWAVKTHKEKWDDLAHSGLLKSATPYMPDTNLIASGPEE